ncbi:metallophosphoesterase [Dasania marina]|uniref:metallophosphoesterase n=1 Tax=Dasania marina TaxID=471499 RepID=UPI0030DA1EDB|tara:strand:+ start:47422 stop:48468 length:1047 start_codon:yes stop_codon:yes gene_type:complete
MVRHFIICFVFCALFILISYISIFSFYPILIPASWNGNIEFFSKINDEYKNLSISSKNNKDKNKIDIVIFGDAGTGSENQYDVAASMWDFCQIKSCDFLLGLGDNFYPSGVSSINDKQWVDKFEVPYHDFIDENKANFWMVVGNHDRRGSVQAQIDYSKKSPIWRMPSSDYPIPNLPGWLKIYVLDTNFIIAQSYSKYFQDKASNDFNNQLARASEYLCQASGWKIIVTHHPMISNGKAENLKREERLKSALLPFLDECDIDVLISGHTHMQQHITLGDRDYIIQGAAGRVRKSHKPLADDQALSKFLAHQLGFSYLSVTEKMMSVTFNDETGRELYNSVLATNKSTK